MLRDAGDHVLVMAKSPIAGRVKTRLCPPCTPAEAAEIAEAALADTLAAVAACGATRRIVALDGPPGDWLPEGFTVIPQVDGALAARLTAAWGAAGGPGLQIAMDTPQVTAAELDAALTLVHTDGCDAAIGLAADGGWWAIGFVHPHPDAFTTVPMSTPATGALQRARLRELGLRVRVLPTLRDIDTIDDALAVAADAPGTRVARAVGSICGLVATR